MRTHHFLAVAVCVVLLLLAAALHFGAPETRPDSPEESEPTAQGNIRIDSPQRQPDGEFAAKKSAAADSGNEGEPAPAPVDLPSAPTQQPDHETPQSAPRDFLVDLQAPVLDWKLTSADYIRIMESPDSTEAERLEARARQMGDFANWPGRDVPRLGGFAFRAADYRLLDGLQLHEPLGPRVRLGGNPPSVSIERRVVFIGDGFSINVLIRVFSSREWAQYDLLGTFVQLIHGSGHRHVKHDTEIGDVCRIAPERNGGASKVELVRHNVVTRLTLAGRDTFAANMLTLASEIDAAIQAQSHRAQTWEELAPHRPVIETFRPSVPAIQGVLPRPGMRQPELDMLAEAALDIRVKGDGVKLHCRPDHAARKGDAFRVWLEEAPKTVYASRPMTETTTFDIWLVAYDDSLLFSTAAAAITVHPPSPPK